MLLLHLRDRPGDARQSHGHVVAEPIDRVVRPSGEDRLDGKVCPLRKLRDEQAADESCVDVHLVGMHLASGHQRLRERIKRRTNVTSEAPASARR
jgi:hypothetical protein